MKSLFYTGEGTKLEGREGVPASRRAELTKPEDYRAEPGLAAAVNVALLLGQPLLLTGEPGTGKTQLAYSLAWELDYGEPLKFETKSTSTARDLFYTYDALGRFQARESGVNAELLSYINFCALGIAILRANDEASVARFLPPGFMHGGKRRSVVLIDEIDKAPRDFPNDILNEIEGMYFRIPELDNESIAAEPEMQPVVVITSNSEKDLPDAFLRRCIYYHLSFPQPERLKEIVTSRLGEFAAASSTLLKDALDLFFLLRRDASGLRKKPATAELLGWLITLRHVGNGTNPLSESPDIALSTLSSLVKTTEDQPRAEQVVKQWFKSRSR